jgi:glycosyltransferase involved in cell wall biosynthesis
MIVKDEAHVIRACLDSVRRFIDAWVIVDTGSTDGTQQVIREHLRDVPGELHERPWVDFAHNRSEALRLARERHARGEPGDYLLIIDADEQLEADPGFRLPELEHDAYDLEVHYQGVTYPRRQLVRTALPWSYTGVIHEHIRCDLDADADAPSVAMLAGLRTVPRHTGARARDAGTYRRDAQLLERALADEPGNTRHAFYLAQSYRDAGELDKAIAAYRRRAAMGGWREEVWYALYQVAVLLERRGAARSAVVEAYLGAYAALPERAEPLYRIGMAYQERGEHALAHLFLARAARLPRPEPRALFVERAIYELQLPIEYAVACHFVGELGEAVAVNNRLLRAALPAHLVDHVIRNRRFSLDARTPSGDPPATLPRLRVVVDAAFAGTELDECIDSVLAQEDVTLEVAVLGAAPRLPEGETRFRLVPFDDDADDAVVVHLRASDRLADPQALVVLARALAEPSCQVAYGQHRLASGVLGDAEPPADERDLAARGAALASRSIVGVRGRARPWSTLAFGTIRFLDEVLSISSAASPARAPALDVSASPAADDACADPLISCLLVTRDRLSLARRAIRSFADQTWKRRELVVVTDGSPRFKQALAAFVTELRLGDVRFVYPERDDLPLGALRNLSMEAARGDILCQWDDDDSSHPARLQAQLEHMRREQGRASLMTEHLQLYERERLLLWIDWSVGGREQGVRQLAPGTLMMYRDARFRYPESGPSCRQGEDSVILDQLYAAVPVVHMRGAGHLYLYQFHGRNTFSRDHHQGLSRYRGVPRVHLEARREQLCEALRYYDIPRPVYVVGPDGPAFAMS